VGPRSDTTKLFTCATCSRTFKEEFDLHVHESFDHMVHISVHCSSDYEGAKGRGLGASDLSSTRTEPNSDLQSNTDEGIL